MVMKACTLHNDEGGSSPKGPRPHMATGHVVLVGFPWWNVMPKQQKKIKNS